MQLMDRLIVNDGVAKVIDLGFHAFDEFFKMTDEIGFLKEAARRGVAPIILFVADTDRVSARAYPMLQEQIPPNALITIDNEYVVRGELPGAMGQGRVLRITALPLVPEDLCRPADLLLHRLSAQREGFIDRAAPVDPQELHQLSRAGAQPARRSGRERLCDADNITRVILTSNASGLLLPRQTRAAAREAIP